MKDFERKSEEIAKLQAALEFFKEQDDEPLAKKQEWVGFLQGKIAKFKLKTPAALSPYFNASTENDYANTQYSGKISTLIEEYIDTKYKYVWNKRKKEFVPASIEQGNTDEHEWLLELAGVWKGYSWNNKQFAEERKAHNSNEVEQGATHINIFKIVIVSLNEVYCQTTRTSYTGFVRAITDEKFYIELAGTDSNRMAFFIGNIGSWKKEKLKDLNGITMAYCESGIEKIKAGIAVLQKVDEPYDNISVKRTPVELLSPKIIKFLTGNNEIGTQLAPPIYSRDIFEENLTE